MTEISNILGISKVSKTENKGPLRG